MNNTTTTYHPLGDYIRPVDVRNRDLQVTKLLGLSIEKCFIPSIANTIGTDMSTYKIVMPGQFAYGPVTSRNGDKITIALYTGDEPAIISQAYSVFEIVGECDTVETRRATSLQLLPEYLMMWFRRPEFDRYARYHSHGSAREIFDWAEMCATMVPVPPISEQRAVVADYEAVARRIAVAKRTIATLQATAQALYRKMFVDGIDKENLPEGWRRNVCIDDILEIKYGSTLPSTQIKKEGKYPVYGANGVIGYYDLANCNDYVCLITSRGNGSGDVSRTCVKQSYVTNNSFIVTAKKEYSYCRHPYIYYLLLTLDFKSICTGSAQPQLTNTSIHLLSINLPNRSLIENFSNDCGTIMRNIDLQQQEIEKLTEIQTIMLSGMGR